MNLRRFIHDVAMPILVSISFADLLSDVMTDLKYLKRLTSLYNIDT